MFDAQPAVALAMRLLQTLVGIQNHVHRIGAQRMRHDLIPARIEFHDQSLVVMGCINERWNQPGAAVGKELHQVGRHPVIVIELPRPLQIGQKARRQVMLHGDRPEARARAHGERAAVAQGAVELDLGQIAGGVDDAGDAQTVQVPRRGLDHRQFFLERHADGDRTGGEFHGRLEQHTARMSAGVANHAAFFVAIGDRLIGDAGHLQGGGVQP